MTAVDPCSSRQQCQHYKWKAETVRHAAGEFVKPHLIRTPMSEMTAGPTLGQAMSELEQQLGRFIEELKRNSVSEHTTRA